MRGVLAVFRPVLDGQLCKEQGTRGCRCFAARVCVPVFLDEGTWWSKFSDPD